MQRLIEGDKGCTGQDFDPEPSHEDNVTFYNTDGTVQWQFVSISNSKLKHFRFHESIYQKR